MEISRLRKLQENFETERASTPEAQELHKKSEELISQFQQKFDRNKLRSMTLQEYVVGQKSKDSFCYWLVWKTKAVGQIFVGGAGYTFGVYYNKKEGTYKVGGGARSKVVSEDEANEELEKIKAGLIKLLSFAERAEFEKMITVSEELLLDQGVIAKILTLYFPDKYLGVFSIRHLDEFLENLGLSSAKTKGLIVFEKRALLLEFKEKDEIMKNWSNRKFVDFLYDQIKHYDETKTSEAQELSYFILRTGGGDYSDQPESKYNFKEGIPGYKQLNSAKGKARFVYLENGFFYGKGKIGKIKSYNENGIKQFDAQVLNYEKMEPVRFEDVSNKLSKSLSQAGIMKIPEEDYKVITGFHQGFASEYTIDDFVGETGFEKSVIKRWEKLLRRKQQIIFQGPPGTGKTYVALRLAKLVAQPTGLVEIVQFHPDYSYEDFIQGYFPEPKDGSANLQFKLKKGRFHDFCDRARKQPKDAPCVMIIDEINRAKLARVFGELMYLLEYRNKEIPLAAGGPPFKIPENVYLIGTMNTADRSIALVDHALRRRFSFIRLKPEYNILANHLKKKNLPADSLVTVLQRINMAINDLNYEVGISFFMKDNDQLKQWLPDIWKTEIEPYLEEYFYDQKSKVESFRWDKLAKNELKEWTL